MSGKHGIRIPGLLLDELKTHDYTNDERFQTATHSKNKKKRSAKNQVSRKERRKQQRLEKSGNSKKAQSALQPKFNLTHAQKGPSENKRSAVPKKVIQLTPEKPFPSDDELSSGDFDEFDEDDLDDEEWEQLRELEEEGHAHEDEEDGKHDDSDEEPSNTSKAKSVHFDLKEENSDLEENGDKEMTVEETMAALMAMKSRKNKPSIIKPSKKEPKLDETEVDYPAAPVDRIAIERDELDMRYYAKKLGLKGKSKKIRAKDEFDAIGGLLEGLDFIENFGEEDDDYGNFARDENTEERNSRKEQDSESDVEAGLLPSDDELSSDDFDDFEEGDLNEEEWAQLRDLEEEDQDGHEEIDTSTAGRKPRTRENPLVAPVVDHGAYVPPSLRKAALEDKGESVTALEVRKSVKSSLNKLSDSNITTIISSLNELYDKYPRKCVTEAVTKQILDIVNQENKLLDSFIMNYSAVIFSLWKLRGTEIGALFIQSAVECFLQKFDNQIDVMQPEDEDNSGESAHIFSKESGNIVTLLAYCYNLGFISCRLIYDLIHLFVESPNEFTAELLLKVISISGPLIRGDDPSALKEIISELLANIKTIKNLPLRLKFLLDTMSDLKNNRLKPSILATSHQPLKKTLQGILNATSSSSEPLLVSLEDIRDVERKGKWWLIGSSWRGNMDNAFEEVQTPKSKVDKRAKNFIIEDDLLDDIPNWSKLAKEQRMNTDVRRAIFISIMSAQDYIDAFTKLEKLNLKNRQSLEMPKVILHCLSRDSGVNGYNPYYALLANKLCEQQHSLVKSFQFLFWDIVKKFEDDNLENDDEEEEDIDNDTRLRNIASRGKFFGYLISEGVLQLDMLKHVPLMSGLITDGILFMEVMLFQLLLSAAKKCEIKKRNAEGEKIVTYKDESMHRLLTNGIKQENKSVILKGLRLFINKKLKHQKYIAGKKGEKNYERDLRRLKWSVPKFVETIDEELENVHF